MKRLIIFLILVPLWAAQAQHTADGFSVSEVPDSVFRLMTGRSYKKGCPVARKDLRYVQVLHYNAEGEELQGEIVCHKDIADDLVEIFRELHRSRYPIERIRLIDHYGADDTRSMRANNSSAFNYRVVAGTKVLSKHSYGKAIDINPLYNPFVKRNGKVEPAEAGRYANRTARFKYKITRGNLCYRLFKRHGFTWGGDWRYSKDYQHFERN